MVEVDPGIEIAVKDDTRSDAAENGPTLVIVGGGSERASEDVH